MSVPTTRPSLAQLRDYVITPEGRVAADSLEVCRCEWHILSGMLVCNHCETGLPLKRSTTWSLPEQKP